VIALTTFLCKEKKKHLVAKSKKEKTGWPNLAESSKKGYGLKRAILPMMMRTTIILK
jgi:hypothetical protein